MNFGLAFSFLRSLLVGCHLKGGLSDIFSLALILASYRHLLAVSYPRKKV